MRITICFLLLLPTLSSISQDLSFNQITIEPLYAEREGPIYACISEITNHSNDSIDVVYTRVTKDFTRHEMINGLCTDQECYLTNIDTVYETIAPLTIHKAESRWLLTDDELPFSEGYSEWEIKRVSTNEVLDTIKSKIIYNQPTTSTENTTENEVQIYPNPAQDYINISQGNYTELKILDFKGQEILNLKDPKETKINISEFQAGPYIVILEIENRIETIKFFKL